MRYVRTGRSGSLCAAIAWLVIGLAFFEKAIVLAPLLFVFTAAFLMGPGTWAGGALATLRRYWRAWLVYGAITVGYVVVFFVALHASGQQAHAPSSLSAAGGFAWTITKDTLTTGALGGPWRWLQLADQQYALAAPPTACMLAICVGLAFLPVAGTEASAATAAVPGQRASGGHRASAATSQQQNLRYAASALVAIFVVSSIWSVHTYESSAPGGPAAKTYFANAKRAVQLAKRGTVVLDQHMPQRLVEGLFGKQEAVESTVIGDLEQDKLAGKFRWVDQPAGTVDGMYIFGADGGSSRSSTGWVLSRSSWCVLEDFDLVGRQTATVHVANRGMMKRLIWPYPRYVNSVLFIPAEQGRPG